MVLLEVLSELIPISGLAVAHFNHGLRGKESDGDEALVRRRSEEKGIPFETERAGVGPRSEAALRKARRTFLRKAQERFGADYILTAHHSDDQLETFIMRLVRGAGIDGLASIHPRRNGFLRPFLSVGRSKLRDFARKTDVPFREDVSNRSETYLRNRIRLRLVPELESLAREFGGWSAFLGRFSATVDELRETSRRRARQTSHRYRELCVETPFWTRLARAPFLEMKKQTRERILRRVFTRLGASVPSRVELAAVEAALRKNQRALSATGGIEIEISCGIVFFHGPRQRAARRAWTLACSPLPPGLEWRFFRPGDTFQGKKLKERFLELRIPRPERHLLPIVARCGSSEVVWHYPQAVRSGIGIPAVAFPFSFH